MTRDNGIDGPIYLESDEPNDSFDHPWLSDVLKDLDDKDFAQDDLLTDAVSEFMKIKHDFASIEDFTNEGIEKLLDENFCAEVFADASSHSETICSGITSGYSSRSLSSGSPSPVNTPQNSMIVNEPDSQSSLPEATSVTPVQNKNNTENCEKPVNSHTTVDSKRRYVLNTLSSGRANHVRLILKPNHTNANSNSSNNCSVTVINNSQISTANKSQSYIHVSTKSIDQSSRLPIVLKSAEPTIPPLSQHSPSSSESDSRDNFEEDGIATINDIYNSPNKIARYDLLDQQQHLSLRPNHLFKRSSQEYSRQYVAYSSTTVYNSNSGFYSQDNRSYHTVNGRIRSPHPDRSDPSQSGVLILTEEEKRTLISEGYPIPTKLPLTKQEERNLKKVRRKIKNKISAQESRRKKKEYVEALERKLNSCAQENVELKRRNENLESTNRSLLGQLRLMQQLLNKPKNNTSSDSPQKPRPSTTNTPPDSTQNKSTSTCLMVFALCFVALFAGQPSDFHYPSSLDSGLTFGPLRQRSFFNGLVSHGSERLVAASISQVAYPWSNSQRGASHSRGPVLPNRSDCDSSWFSWVNQLRLQCPQANAWSTLPRRQGYEAVPRSRLLGAPSEFEPPTVPAYSFWSYMFNTAAKSHPPSIPLATCSSTNLHSAGLQEPSHLRGLNQTIAVA